MNGDITMENKMRKVKDLVIRARPELKEINIKAFKYLLENI